MVGGVVEGDHADPFHIRDLLGQFLRRLIGDVGYHDLGGGEGGEVVVHRHDALTGLRVLGQVGGDVVFHIHPSGGKRTENHGKYVQKEEQSLFVHNKRGKLCHKITVRRVLFRHNILLVCALGQNPPPRQNNANIDFFGCNYYNQNAGRLQAINWIRYANIARRFSACLQSRKELFR